MFLSYIKKSKFTLNPINHSLKNHKIFKTNKIIYIYPGDLKGLYYLGIANFIRDNYKLENWSFLGASAGSWVSLFMAYKGDLSFFLNKIGLFSNEISNIEDTKKIGLIVKNNILNHFTIDDFDLSKVNVGIVHIKSFRMVNYIYSDFYSLEDILECCISSSHIPLVTGDLTKKYKGMYAVDGGTTGFPYTEISVSNTSFYIHENIWISKSTKKNIIKSLKSFLFDTHFLTIYKYDFKGLYEKGYDDAKQNKKYLDTFFYHS